MPVNFLEKEAKIVFAASRTIRALNHALRRKIMEVITGHEQITVTEIYIMLRLEQSVASQHLAILRNEQLVTTRRDGKFIYYSVNKKRIDEVVALCEKINALKGK